VTIDERDLTMAREHPRGTERRTLLPYRAALNDPAVYARLPVVERDAIVRWVEVRRRLKHEHGLDHDPSNLADPLLPYAALRSLVMGGENLARAAAPGPAGDAIADEGRDVRETVRAIRGT
jgi:hypothetical protein